MMIDEDGFFVVKWRSLSGRVGKKDDTTDGRWIISKLRKDDSLNGPKGSGLRSG